MTTALLLSTTTPAQQDPPPAPATVKEVMTTMTIPASDVVFGAASDPPGTDEQWATLRKAAETLAASGRLLTRADLARDTNTWTEMARALVSQAEATVKLAEAKRRDGLEQAGNDLYGTCETCHARYLQP